MNKVIVYETNPHLLAFLKIVFKSNSKFDLMAVCRNKTELGSFLNDNNIDTLLLSHTGVLDLKVIRYVSDFFPKVRMVGVYYDDSYLNRIAIGKQTRPTQKRTIDRSIDEFLQELQTVHFD